MYRYYGKAYNNFKTKNEKKIFVLAFVVLTIIPGTVYEIISPIITYIGNENYRFLEKYITNILARNMATCIFSNTECILKNTEKSLKLETK